MQRRKQETQQEIHYKAIKLQNKKGIQQVARMHANMKARNQANKMQEYIRLRKQNSKQASYENACIKSGKKTIKQVTRSFATKHKKLCKPIASTPAAKEAGKQATEMLHSKHVKAVRAVNKLQQHMQIRQQESK